MQAQTETIPEFKWLSGRSLLISFGNVIDPGVGERVSHLANFLQKASENWITEIVPAYCSLSVFFDPMLVAQQCGAHQPMDWIIKKIQDLLTRSGAPDSESSWKGALHDIPVYYDGEDLKEISTLKKLSESSIVEIHSSKEYTVFMIGFLPGFAYLGTVDERIAAPRRERPRTRVAAGSVAIAGLQTGVYPLDSPGGWQIIGRTPLVMFNPESSSPSRLKHGDRVRFFPVSADQFEKLREH